MDLNEDNNSIFGSNLGNNPIQQPYYPKNFDPGEQKTSFLDRFINLFKNKLEENIEQHNQPNENITKELQALVEEHTETLLILKSFGCKIEIKSPTLIEIHSDELHMIGFINIDNGNAKPDEECIKLFTLISNIISGGYRIEEILNKYEQEEFYPIGEIIQVPVMYKGTEITVSKGMLVNPKGETKEITFYKGYELTPDEETNENT